MRLLPKVDSALRRVRILPGTSNAARPVAARPIATRAVATRIERRDCQGRLLAALQALAGPDCAVEEASQRLWCSATFVGAQHRILLRLSGAHASERAAALEAMLPEAEIALAHHIVVDLVVDQVSAQAAGHVHIALAVLTIEDW